MKFTRLLFVFVAMSIGLNAYAGMPPKPERCPSTNAIMNGDLAYAWVDNHGNYTVAQTSKYDTNDIWAFGFVSIKASSSEDALRVGKSWLKLLSGNPQPVALQEQNVWACIYNTWKGNYGLAITPLKATGIRTLHTIIV